MADQDVAMETLYRVRRGGTKRPVGTLLTSTEFQAIHNHKSLLSAGYFVVVMRPKEKP